MRGVLSAERALFGPAHEQTLETLALVGKIYGKMRDFDKAESVLRDTLGVQRELLGNEHLGTLATMHYLAELLESQSRWKEAVALRREEFVGYLVARKTERDDEYTHLTMDHIVWRLMQSKMFQTAQHVAGLYFPMPNPGTLELQRSQYTVKESDGFVMLGVVRIGGSDGVVGCRVRTKDGNAEGGKDYVAIDQLVVFQDGDTNRTVKVDIVDDAAEEPDEDFYVIMSEPYGGVKLHSDPEKLEATVTIICEDMVKRLEGARKAADADGDGLLDLGEFSAYVRTRGEEYKVMSDVELKVLFNQLDEDGSGQVDKAEYIGWELREQLSKNASDLQRKFKAWDVDNSGTVNKSEFYKAVRSLGFDAQEADTDAVFDKFDDDGSGQLDYHELLEKLAAKPSAPSDKRAAPAPAPASAQAPAPAPAHAHGDLRRVEFAPAAAPSPAEEIVVIDVEW